MENVKRQKSRGKSTLGIDEMGREKGFGHGEKDQSE